MAEAGEEGNCTVCLTLIEEHVMMCPECSALLCKGCINNLKKNECPGCRAPIQKSSYVRCRFMEEILKKSKQSKQSQIDICEAHGEEKSWYCSEAKCRFSLCPDCFLEGHLGHKKVKAKEFYTKCKEQVIDQLEPIEKRITDLTEKRRKVFDVKEDNENIWIDWMAEYLKKASQIKKRKDQKETSVTISSQLQILKNFKSVMLLSFTDLID